MRVELSLSWRTMSANYCGGRRVRLNKGARGSVCLQSWELYYMNTKMKPITLLLVVAFVSALTTERLLPAEGKSSKADGGAAGEDLFARPKVYRIKLELPDSARDALRREPR